MGAYGRENNSSAFHLLQVVHPLGRSVFDFDSWNKAEKKNWIKQIHVQAPEKAETLHNINNQIRWAIMHKEYVFERGGFGWFLVMFC